MICQEGYEWRRQLKNGWFPTLESGEERFRLKLRKSDCCPTGNLGDNSGSWKKEDQFHHEVDCRCVHRIHVVQRVHLEENVYEAKDKESIDCSPRPPCLQGKRSPRQGGPFELGWPQCSFIWIGL